MRMEVFCFMDTDDGDSNTTAGMRVFMRYFLLCKMRR